MPNRSVRWYDAYTNRLVCASPTWLTIWEGRRPVQMIAGPHRIPKPLPKTAEELKAVYTAWVFAGEPE